MGDHLGMPALEVLTKKSYWVAGGGGIQFRGKGASFIKLYFTCSPVDQIFSEPLGQAL